MKMNTEKAIEILEEIKEIRSTYFKNKGNYKPFEHYASLFRDDENIDEVITLLKTKQELVTKFSSEVEEQQKNLDQIDLWAMEIQMLIKKIRGKI